ncbi:hypothetical protein [Paenibacillus sacheonensis]|uniref:Extracellular solute-binding protein n=1 Tax=Paenibacillus sacheonensis TaxID=742054 RepID=A0A7X4YL55_9BACL|nr:hypothetical protein [Paenibacillus sacheonensis]MBM7564283.1 hypothetical protein [Paenibacillus sacheonensis]NBC67394.1 hypothetical protein [Paenibacillus sacheonensis]
MTKYAKGLLAVMTASTLLLGACNNNANDGNKAGAADASKDNGSNGNANANNAAADNAPANAEKISLKWMIPTQQKAPVGDSLIMQEIKQKFNVDIEFVEAPPGDQYDEKKKLAIASQAIPDLMTWVMKDEANKYGPEGAFLEITPLLDRLPELKKKLDADPNGKYNAFSPDEKLWRLPDYITYRTCRSSISAT